MEKDWHFNYKRLCSSEKKDKKMQEWFSKHVDTLCVIGSILSAVIWMNGKFSDVEKDIARLDKEISIIKAVMIVKHILPPDLANAEINHE